MSTYFNRSFKYTFLVNTIAPQLSPNIYTSLGSLLMYFVNYRSLKIYTTYQPCFAQVARAMYSASQLDVATKRYFLLNYKIRLLQNIVTLLNILFRSTLLLAQLELEYSTNYLCTLPSLQRILVLTVDFRYRSSDLRVQP